MRILFMNPFFHPYYGGTEKHVLEVGRRLAKKHEVSVLTARLEGTHELEEYAGMKIVREPTDVYYSAPHPIPPPVPVFKKHNQYLNEALKHCDLVHMHNRFVYSINDDAAKIKKHHKKLCLTLHNAKPQNIDPITDFFGSLFDDMVTKKLMTRCDGIIGVSRATLKTTLPEGYDGKTAAIHNGVDEKLFRPVKSREWKERLGIRDSMVLTNVRLLQQKGVYYLISAMKHVNAELVVFGRGPLKRQLEIHARAIGAKVHFVTERITDEELVSLYAASDCFALPSLYEPCSVALIEAMACGKAVIATDAGGNKELIKHQKGGLIVPARDADALAKGINAVLHNKKLATKFGHFNRKRVLEHFNWDRVARDVERFYKSL